MTASSKIKVWNFDLPPYPREGLFHLDMSGHCQVNRLLTFEAGRLAQLHQLDVIGNRQQLHRFQTGLRKKLWKKFGCRYDRNLPLEIREFGTIRQKDFSVTKLIYQSRPGLFVTSLLYVPSGKGPFPAVLQMHGHNPEGKFGVNPQSTALALVKSGYVCLSVDSFGTYERADTCYTRERHGGFLGAGLLNIGETLMGAQVVDNMRGVDLLQSLPFVERKKIGAVGASGGGNQTMWLSAMDTRIAAAMPVVSVGSFESYVYGVNCICELLPDGLTLTEEAGILALIAPRPLRIGNALYDCNHDFSVSEMLKTYHPVERIYWKLGVPEKISFHVADRVHGMTDRQRESMLGFFAFALKGSGNGNPLPEPEYELFPEETLHLFADPSERAANKVRSILEHCRTTGSLLREKYLSRRNFHADTARRELKELLRLQPLPPVRLHRYADVCGAGRAALEAGMHLIPFLILRGNVPGRYRIVLHPEGKEMLDAQTLDEAASDGSTLILPDLFGTGETAQPNHTIALHHQLFRQLLWIGHSLSGEWTGDLLALTAMLRRCFKAAEIHVTGIRETGFAALCANVFTDRINSVETRHTPGSLFFDYEKTISLVPVNPFEKFLPGGIYSPALSFPGFLNWGDVSLVAALGNGTVYFHSPCTFEGKVYTDAEKHALENEVRMIREKLGEATVTIEKIQKKESSNEDP